MKKKLIAMLLSAAMCLSLAACGQKADTPDTTDPAEPSGDAATYTVGICQLVQHEALDAATQGFIDALNEALPGEVEFQNKNASGDSANCSTIVNGFVSDGVDLIMANATAALQAAASATSDIPVLGTSITAYGVALDIDDFSGTVGGTLYRLAAHPVQKVIARVCYLVGHHHTYDGIDGMDYQILVEADFLVNLFEDKVSPEGCKNAYHKIFRTESGKRLYRTMYPTV